jgi:hypothetical protein
LATALVRLYTARGELALARANLPDVPEALRADLANRLDELEQTRAAEAAGVAALRRDLDELSGTEARPWLSAALGVSFVAATVVSQGVLQRSVPRIHVSLAVSVALAAVGAAIIFIFRRRVASTQLNRVLATFVLTALVGRAALCLVEIGFAGSGRPMLMGLEQVLYAGLAAIAAVTTRRPFYRFLVATFATGAMVSALFPTASWWALDASLAVAVLLAVVSARADVRRRAAGQPPP